MYDASSFQLDVSTSEISRVCAVHSWKLNLKVDHKKNSISTCHIHCFVHYISINIVTFLTVFGRFPTTFRKFSSILLLIPEPRARFRRPFENVRRLRKIWRCCDHTPTNLSIVKGSNMSWYQTLRQLYHYRKIIVILHVFNYPILRAGNPYKWPEFIQ